VLSRLIPAREMVRAFCFKCLTFFFGEPARTSELDCLTREATESECFFFLLVARLVWRASAQLKER